MEYSEIVESLLSTGQKVSAEGEAVALLELSDCSKPHLIIDVLGRNGQFKTIFEKELMVREVLETLHLPVILRVSWGFSKDHANRFIASAKANQNLMPIGIKPTHESQLRPLTHLEPEQQKEVMYGHPVAAERCSIEGNSNEGKSLQIENPEQRNGTICESIGKAEGPP